MVDRYVMTEYPHECYMERDDDGQYVLHSDYAALQAENEQLKVEIKVTEDNLAFAMRSIGEIESQGYTAADVATAAADGFRDGVRSVDLEKFRKVLDYAYEWGGSEVGHDLYRELSELIDAHKGE